LKQDLVIQRQKPKDFSRFFNEEGKIRLHHVRGAVFGESISDEDLVKLYKQWKSQNEYLCLYRKKKGAVRDVTYGYDFKFVKCSKRGNKVYNWRIRKRFDEIETVSYELGHDFIFDPNAKIKKTNVLFCTFTYDTKRMSSYEAWFDIGRDWNRTITRLRRSFDCGIEVLRVWESTKKGYPHIHAVLIFVGKEFEVFEHVDKADSENTSIPVKTSYRLSNSDVRETIQNSYHSHVDVQGVNSVGGAVGYILKYLRKEHSDDPDSQEPVQEMKSSSLSLAKMWLHKKRSYAVSGGFAEKLKEIRLDSLSAQFKSKTIQITFDGKKIDDRWHILRRKDKKGKSVIATFSEKELWKNKKLQVGIERGNFVLETSNVFGIKMGGCFVE